MVEKKGFTLIELLAAIAILAILSALAIPAVSRIINSVKEKSLAATVINLKDSAMVHLISEQKSYGLYWLNELTDSGDDLKSPFGGNLLGYILIDCEKDSRCKTIDFIYEQNGENYKKVEDGVLKLDETKIENVGLLSKTEMEVGSGDYNIFMLKYGYTKLPIDGDDSDVYNLYILNEENKEKKLKKIEEDKNYIVNAKYKYKIGDNNEFEVLVLANDGDKLTLLITDDNYLNSIKAGSMNYSCSDVDSLINKVKEKIGDKIVRMLDLGDIIAKTNSSQALEFMLKNDDNSMINDFGDNLLSIMNDYEHGYFISDWKFDEQDEEERTCIYLSQDINYNYYLKKDDVNTLKGRIGIVFETTDYDKMIKEEQQKIDNYEKDYAKIIKKEGK